MKIFLLFAFALFISANSFAQKLDENGFPIYKEMSEADAQRILGDMYSPKFFKVNGEEKRYTKESIINGNKITTILYNYASICKPNTLGNIADLVWNGLGYGFEFGPLAAAPVVNNSGATVNIVSDSFVLTGQGDWNSDGTLKWGWLPKNGYVDTTEGQNEIARLGIADTDGDGKPDSWPDKWYSPEIGKYVWPAFLGDQSSAPDEEVYYVVDDFANAEFDYTPSPSDSSIKGLGLDMEVRVLQFNNSLAEDIMFLVYQITNASEKKINGAYFGMHGDPHVGGSADYGDDRADFIDPFGESIKLANVPQRARSMVYAWDEDMVGAAGRPTGYFGWKFLESPSNNSDGIDNDDDGLIDESPDNSAGYFIDGITIPVETNISDIEKFTAIYGTPKERFSGDEDGDWDVTKDDIGIDGIGPDSENYPGADYGEGDGVPSQGWYSDVNGDGEYNAGEPISDIRSEGLRWAGSELNFGLRDISESDQIGLSSFHAAAYTNSDPNVPRNDPLMWQWLSSDSISADQELLNTAGDNIFNFGTGPLDLEAGETQRFSMAILFGNNVDHLLLNAETSTRILESDYRFAKPPNKPNLSVVPGDGRVTLYWDDYSEQSFDPFIRSFDFQGYKIYRSRDPKFQDVKTITDGFGNPFIGEGIAQFDVVDSLSGFHPVEFLGRGIKYNIGKNEGLVHEYVDSTVTNGITYYYALAAYDGGSIKFNIPPTETQTIINVDPITSVLSFDPNTAMAIPMGDVSGLTEAEAGVSGRPDQIKGNSTGDVILKIIEPQNVSNKFYTIEFADIDRYNVFDSTGVKDAFVSKDTVYVDLVKQNIKESSFVVTDAGGNIINKSKYLIKAQDGKIRGNKPGDLPTGEAFNANYTYFPVKNSTLIDSSDANPVFDGMRLFVSNQELNLSTKRSVWADNVNTNIVDKVLFSKSNADYVGTPHVQYRADWEVRWLDLADTAADGSYIGGDSVLAVPSMKFASTPFNIINITEVDSNGSFVKGNYMIDESKTPKTAKNGRWDFGEGVILRPTTPKSASEVSYLVLYSLRPDTTSYDTTFVVGIPDSVDHIDTLVVKSNPILPKAGDVYHVRTDKPFQIGDKYSYSSKAVEINPAAVKSGLDKINVVPNPYVGYSMAEEPGRLPEQRGERQLQFRNLPQECTIRIYTITGELVKEIYKNDFTSYATWDLLSFEGHRIAYGVYIYHVDVPNVGEKIGRIGVIK
ncbi:MAG: hypothetical protein KKF62_18040 [Bacteroidetes bacterium]|nr:hypothetical protein [Bacteroidota bacterium]MBU1113566.1 hypothetical protein [Bacteroidota bacterium]MBU1798632.1 hypothetical protein [Bacteroidota bacterium]